MLTATPKEKNYIIKKVINDYLPAAKKLIVLIKEEYHLK